MTAPEFITRKGRILPLEERLDPRSTALIIVDVQNDFCDKQGVFGLLGADVSMMPAMAENLGRLLDAARQRDMLIVWVRATYDEVDTSDTLAETYHRRGFIASQCLEGSWGAEFYHVVPRSAPNEVVVTKHRFSPFFDTPIDLYLRCNGISSVIVTGVVTSGCVDSTARDAFFNDYYVTVAEDCVAEASHERHTAALRKLAQSFGVVMPSAEIRSVWDRMPQKATAWQLQAKQARQLRDLPARLNPSHTALLLIDASPAATPAIAALLRQARARGVMVVHVSTAQAEAAVSDVQLCLPRQTAQPAADLAPLPGEPTLALYRADAFVDSTLAKLLRVNRIRTLVIAGTETHVAVESTVRHAAMLDFYAVVPSDCVAARDGVLHLHRASLETMAGHFAEVCTSADIADCWAQPVSPADAA